MYAALLCFISGAAPCLIWILGHAYVAWGAKRADVRPNGRQLGFPKDVALVRWIRAPGMSWSRVMAQVHQFARLDRVPDILLVHARGYDLGLSSMRKFIQDIKFDFLRLCSFYLDLVFVWSNIGVRT